MAPSIIFGLAWIWFVSIWLFNLVGFFKTEYIEKFEIKLFEINLLLLNLIFLFLTTLVFLTLYNDWPFLESVFEFISFIDDVVFVYIVVAFITVLVITARVITAKRLQRILSFRDYYKIAIAFIFLPIGIFRIQREVNDLMDGEKNKKSGYAFIGFTVLIVAGTIANFLGNELEVSFGTHDTDDFNFDNGMPERSHLQDDTLFYAMSDALKADSAFKEAIQLYHSGDFLGAINNINMAIQDDSLNTDYYFNRAVILFEQFDQLDAAVMDLTKVIQIDSSDWKAYQNRGYYYYLNEQYDKALSDINMSIQLNPDFSNAYLLRGLLKEKLNDSIDACADYKTAERLGNEDAILKLVEFCD
ncbi:MAG: tetratricopeptide repeat protein [Cryomorphaceae bacterium]|nr:tetratricopeptide repeat protein [Cryomorphaceae bacterium]